MSENRTVMLQEESNRSAIVLVNTSLATTGRYRCEVSTEERLNIFSRNDNPANLGTLLSLIVLILSRQPGSNVLH